jgi:hypothetical protein
MSFSRVFWSILVIGIVIIGAVILFLMWQSEMDTKEGLESRLSTAQSTLPQLNQSKSQLETELSDLEAELSLAMGNLEDAEENYPPSISTVDYGYILFEIAEDNFVDVLSYYGSTPIELARDGVSFMSTAIEITVSGDLQDILDYVIDIEVGLDFNTTELREVEMSVPQAPAPGEPTDSPICRIYITILSYQG